MSFSVGRAYASAPTANACRCASPCAQYRLVEAELRSSSDTVAGRLQVDDDRCRGVLVRSRMCQRRYTQMSIFSTVPPSLRTTLRDVSNDGATVRSSRWVKDDHDFVWTHRDLITSLV